MTEPGRKHLPHEIPTWIDPSREIYFITICCQPRHLNQLCHNNVAAQLFETVKYRKDCGIWFARLFLLMPDHLHALLSFPPGLMSIRKLISLWKAWTARECVIQWQRDFFEHRLRDDENYREKADYILGNPVRAGLVARAEDWPYVWIPSPS
jgi:putative transposase